MIKFVYSLFLGILLVLFVGMGVAAFYPAPKAPLYPVVTDKTLRSEAASLDTLYREQSDAYNEKYQVYNRNVSIIVLVAALMLLVVSLALHSKVEVLADGLMIGGTLTLIYSIVRSFGSQSPRYTFSVVSVGIAVTLIVGYLKFVGPIKRSAHKK